MLLVHSDSIVTIPMWRIKDLQLQKQKKFQLYSPYIYSTFVENLLNVLHSFNKKLSSY